MGYKLKEKMSKGRKNKEKKQQPRYKHLGITFDGKVSWKHHVHAVVKKVHSRLYCLRKLGSFDVRKEIVQMFYTATISSVY